MTSLLSASSGPVVHAALTLERKDIVFHNPNPEEVEISITLSHVADRPSAPAMVRMQAAPLGAFVPWQPLGDVLVPMLEPRRRHILRFRLQRPRPTVLGDPSQLPIARLLNALARAEPQRAPGAQLLLRFGGGSIGFQTGALPADLFELVGHANPHWAGNLNVFVGVRAVERHLAQALRIYPGRTNMAGFVVGCGPDAYAFHLVGDGAGWDAALFDSEAHGKGAPLCDPDRADPVVEDRWIQIRRQRFILLAIRPPADCTKGNVEVHVTQRSTGQTAVVEFSMDPQAAGPGCFVVS